MSVRKIEDFKNFISVFQGVRFWWVLLHLYDIFQIWEIFVGLSFITGDHPIALKHE